MKSFLLVIPLTLILMASVMLPRSIITKPTESKEISDINYFYFTYTKGYAMNSYVTYQINKTNNKYIAKIKPYGKSEDEKIEKEISKEDVTKLEKILNKYNVSSWNGFNKTDKNVLDGDSFSCTIYAENDVKVSASGYMMWPENYRNVVSELDVFFEQFE